MQKETLEERAERVVLSTVRLWRDHGLTDEQMIAAGRAAITKSIASHVQEGAPDGGFELRAMQDVTAAICALLPTRASLGVTLCKGDFKRAVNARVKKLGSKLAEVRKRYELEIDKKATGLSAYALAVFDLYDERWAEIQAAINGILVDDETAQKLAPADEDGEVPFTLHELQLPADGEDAWRIILSFDDSDSCAHLDLEGWTVQRVGWTH
ncbi:MAG: hypothetical protein SFX73_15880 [Kofleriaceae bacterium]|nr:hypothetical protein [Kofleriaceae bacterium]